MCSVVEICLISPSFPRHRVGFCLSRFYTFIWLSVLENSLSFHSLFIFLLSYFSSYTQFYIKCFVLFIYFIIIAASVFFSLLLLSSSFLLAILELPVCLWSHFSLYKHERKLLKISYDAQIVQHDVWVTTVMRHVV